MRRLIGTTIAAGLMLSLLASRAGAQTRPKPRSVVGDQRLHTLKFGDKDRTIRVWVPPGYNVSADRSYPVLYMHDGQNCFDNATAPFGEWKIDEALTALAKDGSVDVPIVVGIDNGGNDRIAELTYTQDNGRGGNGAQYERFVMETVLPFVEKNYRVRPDRASTVIGGSSLGGTMSIELAMRHPDKFGKVLAMSPSLWWNRLAMLKDVATNPAPLQRTTLYVDMGEREGPEGPSRAQLVEIARRFDALLTAGQIEHQFDVDPIGEHNEASWSRRFPAAVKSLLPPANAATTTTAPASPD